MKKRIFAFVICLLCLISFSSCGYNHIMYEHLSNIENYETYTATIEKISVVKDGQALEYYEGTHTTKYIKGAVYLDISTEEISYSIRVMITEENSNILLENGFYEIIKKGLTVEIQTSNWIYGDTPFNYVIGIKYDGTEYLNSQEGLENIIEMMDADRSFF